MNHTNRENQLAKEGQLTGEKKMSTAFQKISAATDDNFIAVVEAEIKKIPMNEESNTYLFMARNEGWNEILICAREDGYDDVADICEHAMSECTERFGGGE